MEAPENFGRRLHPAEVEFVLHPPDVPLAEGRPAAGDQVEIAPSPGHVAGMEARRRLLHLEDVDRGGEEVVETMEDLLQRETVRGVQVGDLGKGMDAGVGPAGPLDLHLPPEELPGGIDQGPLDAPGVFLHLPAAVAGPVILQRELVFASRKAPPSFRDLPEQASGSWFRLRVRPVVQAALPGKPSPPGRRGRSARGRSRFWSSRPGWSVVTAARPTMIRPFFPSASRVLMLQKLWKIRGFP